MQAGQGRVSKRRAAAACAWRALLLLFFFAGLLLLPAAAAGLQAPSARLSLGQKPLYRERASEDAAWRQHNGWSVAAAPGGAARALLPTHQRRAAAAAAAAAGGLPPAAAASATAPAANATADATGGRAWRHAAAAAAHAPPFTRRRRLHATEYPTDPADPCPGPLAPGADLQVAESCVLTGLPPTLPRPGAAMRGGVDGLAGLSLPSVIVPDAPRGAPDPKIAVQPGAALQLARIVFQSPAGDGQEPAALQDLLQPSFVSLEPGASLSLADVGQVLSLPPARAAALVRRVANAPAVREAVESWRYTVYTVRCSFFSASSGGVRAWQRPAAGCLEGAARKEAAPLNSSYINQHTHHQQTNNTGQRHVGPRQLVRRRRRHGGELGGGQRAARAAARAVVLEPELCTRGD